MSQLPEAFRLEPAGDHRFLASSIGDPSAHDVVFGGQLLAQMLLASAAVGTTGKDATSIHTIFARSATLTKPLEIEVEVMHDGRSLGSDTVTVRQGDRLCARALVLRHAEEPDLIRHQPEMPKVEGPDQAPESTQAMLVAPGTELRVVGGINTWDPEAPVGPPELFVWIRLPEGLGDFTLTQALLSYATDGFLIATAMRPHEGIGQNMAHRSIATGVVSHTLTFHDRFEAGQWLLLAHEGTAAGRGRSYGRAHVFTKDGKAVASFVQESLIRDATPPGAPPTEQRRS
ncbi:MAG TPA: acyl-CoA thioesterase domain-containing protein [Acidimicrobiales bacterium]|nr:acyl-CoA thioesterase domain-containing protein [Acidimicrobiales bacterium]